MIFALAFWHFLIALTHARATAAPAFFRYERSSCAKYNGDWDAFHRCNQVESNWMSDEVVTVFLAMTEKGCHVSVVAVSKYTNEEFLLSTTKHSRTLSVSQKPDSALMPIHQEEFKRYYEVNWLLYKAEMTELALYPSPTTIIWSDMSQAPSTETQKHFPIWVHQLRFFVPRLVPGTYRIDFRFNDGVVHSIHNHTVTISSEIYKEPYLSTLNDYGLETTTHYKRKSDGTTAQTPAFHSYVTHWLDRYHNVFFDKNSLNHHIEGMWDPTKDKYLRLTFHHAMNYMLSWEYYNIKVILHRRTDENGDSCKQQWELAEFNFADSTGIGLPGTQKGYYEPASFDYATNRWPEERGMNMSPYLKHWCYDGSELCRSLDNWKKTSPLKGYKMSWTRRSESWNYKKFMYPLLYSPGSILVETMAIWAERPEDAGDGRYYYEFITNFKAGCNAATSTHIKAKVYDCNDFGLQSVTHDFYIGERKWDEKWLKKRVQWDKQEPFKEHVRNEYDPRYIVDMGGVPMVHPNAKPEDYFWNALKDPEPEYVLDDEQKKLLAELEREKSFNMLNSRNIAYTKRPAYIVSIEDGIYLTSDAAREEEPVSPKSRPVPKYNRWGPGF